MDHIWQRLGIVFTEPIRDPLWGTILLPAEFSSILLNPHFIKLSRILQLGPAHLVYPGATHTRRAHSIGVFFMAVKLLEAVYPEAEGQVVEEGARSFLAAALCHDVGHFPYVHSLKELPLEGHEALTGRIVRGPMAEDIASAGADPAQVASIVDETLPAVGVGTDFFRRLLSGVLDPDKLDYLNRDAWACGVPYGVQDTEFVLRHILLDADGKPGVDERGVMAVEGILFSKYQMYRAVYWHGRVRSATAMVKAAVLAALKNGTLKEKDLYGLDDSGFYALMSTDDRDPESFIRNVFDGRLLPCCWEGGWNMGNDTRSKAAHLASRPAVERELAEAIASLSAKGGALRAERKPRVVIDLPEPISFETGMTVVGPDTPFGQSATVFRPEVIAGFSGNLRVMRVFSDAEPSLAGPAVREVLGD